MAAPTRLGDMPRQLLPLNLTYQTTSGNGNRGWLDDSDQYSMAKVRNESAGADTKAASGGGSSDSDSSSSSGDSMLSSINNSKRSPYHTVVDSKSKEDAKESHAELMAYALSLQRSSAPATCLDNFLSLLGLLEDTQYTKDHSRRILTSKLSLRINTIRILNGTRSCFDILGPFTARRRWQLVKLVFLAVSVFRRRGLTAKLVRGPISQRPTSDAQKVQLDKNGDVRKAERVIFSPIFKALPNKSIRIISSMWRLVLYLASVVFAFWFVVHVLVHTDNDVTTNLLLVIDVLLLSDFLVHALTFSLSSIVSAQSDHQSIDKHRDNRTSRTKIEDIMHITSIVATSTLSLLVSILVALPINFAVVNKWLQFPGNSHDGIIDYVALVNIMRMPVAFGFNVQRFIQHFLAHKRGDVSFVITAKFVIRDLPACILLLHWSICFALWLHEGAIHTFHQFWNLYLSVLTDKSQGIYQTRVDVQLGSDPFMTLTSLCLDFSILIMFIVRVIALTDARAVKNRQEALLYGFIETYINGNTVPHTEAKKMSTDILQWNRSNLACFDHTPRSYEAVCSMDGNLAQKVEHHRRAACCLSELRFLLPTSPQSIYSTNLNPQNSWHLRMMLAKSMRNVFYCVPGQAVVEAGRTKIKELRYLRVGSLEVVGSIWSGEEKEETNGSEIQEQISKLKRKLRFNYKARRHHTPEFRKQEKRLRAKILRKIRTLKQRQRWQPPQRFDSAIFSTKGGVINAGQWVCWEGLSCFSNIDTSKLRVSKATRTLVTASPRVEMVILPLDVLYHVLVDEYPQVLSALRKIAREEHDAQKTFNFSANEESSSDGDSGDKAVDVETINEELSPSSSDSEDDRNFYAYKKDYRQLYYKEVKRRLREKQRRESIEKRLKLDAQENKSTIHESSELQPGLISPEQTSETLSFPPPKYSMTLAADKDSNERANTAGADNRVREWPKSDAIVRVRLEGPTLPTHLKGRTGTRGEWIEKQGKFVVVLDGKSKGRAAMQVRVRGENMVIISPSNKDRPTNTPQPLPDVYFVKHRQDDGAVVQVVRDQSKTELNPKTPDLGTGRNRVSNSEVRDAQFEEHYSREAIDAEYERYKSNSAVLPKASEFSQMPSNKPPPSRGMLGTYLKENLKDVGSAKVSYGEKEIQENDGSPIHDPLNLLGGFMKATPETELQSDEANSKTPAMENEKDDELKNSTEGRSSKGKWNGTMKNLAPEDTEKKGSEDVHEMKKTTLNEMKRDNLRSNVVAHDGETEREVHKESDKLKTAGETRTLFRALHAFPGLEDGDLGLTKGGLVWGVERRGDWWYGQLYSKRNPESTETPSGIFPGNYVEVVEKSGGKLKIEQASLM